MKLHLIIFMSSCLIISNNSFAAAKRQNHFIGALHASLKKLHACGLDAWQNNPQTALEQDEIIAKMGPPLRETAAAAQLLAHSAGNPAPDPALAPHDPEGNLLNSLNTVSASLRNLHLENGTPEQVTQAAQSLALTAKQLGDRTPVHIIAGWASKNPIEH